MRSRTLKTILLVAVAFAWLPGCAGTNQGSGMFPQKPLGTTPVQITHDVRFDAAGKLTQAEQDALEAFFGAVRVSYGDTISVDDPSPSNADQRRTAIAAVAQKFGLPVGVGAPTTGAAPGAGSVRVVVDRPAAVLPPCPDWSMPSNPNFGNVMSSNFGCATSVNLGLMIANPNDLTRGQTFDGTDGAVIQKAIKAWREQKPTGTQELQDTSAEK
jgi:pilus assembly protein CpaD